MKLIVPSWSNQTLTRDLFTEMDRFFDDIRTPLSTQILGQSFYDERQFNPACDVTETDEHYLMSIDLPGLKKDDIRIELTESLLTLSGERKRENHKEKSEKIQRYEKSYGFFKRSFNLPKSVDADKVEARFEDGVLELYIPKVQAAKPKQIEIQNSKAGFFEKLINSKKVNSDEKSAQT